MFAGGDNCDTTIDSMGTYSEFDPRTRYCVTFFFSSPYCEP